MRKLALKMSITIDGFVAGPNGEMDWFLKSRDAAGAAWTVEQISKAGAHLMGRKTFSNMASYWPTSKESFAVPMNEIPKIVFSRNNFAAASIAGLPDDAKSWSEALVLTGDLTKEISHLKKQPGKILVAHGGANFAQNLVQTGLVDEFWLVVHPVALGRGLPLFSQIKSALHLQLISSKTFSSGSVANIFQAMI